MGLQKSPRSITEIGTTEDLNLQISRGQIVGHEIVHKFGRVSGQSTTTGVVAFGKVWPMPLPANALTLRVKAGNAADTAAGAGIQSVVIEGINALGVRQTDTLVTAGASASTPTTQTYIRLTRIYVKDCGTAIVTPITSSMGAAIVIESVAGAAWGTIDVGNYDNGQSEIGAYTIPLGYTGYLTTAHFRVGTTNTGGATVALVKKEGALTAAAPFSAPRILFMWEGVIGHVEIPLEVPMKLDALTDVFFIAKSKATTVDVHASFDIILIKNSGTD